MKVHLVGAWIGLGAFGGATYLAIAPDRDVDEPAVVANALNPDSLEGVFEGRTPCGAELVEFAGYASPACEKMKWQISLYRDAETGAPSRYEFDGTRVKRSGTWRVERGTAADADAVVYRLATDIQPGSIAFFRADDNILLLLDSNRRLMVGDAGFSYTLSRTR